MNQKDGKRSIMDRIWYPSEKDMIQMKVLFYSTIPINLLVHIILNIISPTKIWSITFLTIIILIVSVRVIMGLRITITSKKEDKAKF